MRLSIVLAGVKGFGRGIGGYLLSRLRLVLSKPAAVFPDVDTTGIVKDRT